ncbi:mucin-19-like [Bombus bifarius]|uniref:Mucin-19-like n=1 Tax=Bombus bifarius TaxID=103933 RepID=A0A6P8P3V2_9HYME|nr:mucin-19-like [Bombus bifarius]XP_033320680.1 mucin-19-like [Bombus bifarius]XP_033320681.1 mucin-19-like [Bombus bifarius]XP_033320682.1 mucin-19-like [Bombus bifarius]
MINRTCLAVLIGLLGLACGLQCPKQKLSPGREVVCYTFVSDVDQLTEAVCKCTSLVQQGYDVRNLSVSGFEDFQKSLKKIIPTLQFVVSVDDPGKTLSTSGTVRQEITARLIGVLKEVDGIELNMTAGSKERLVHFVNGLKDELVRKSYDKRIFLVLPTKSEELAKQFDLKELTKYVDLFTVPTHYLVEDDEANHTFHPSRLMGLFDMFNADSLIDLISGLGAPKRKILVSVPASAYKFTLKDQNDNAPRASTEEMQPVTIDQKQLCDLMNNGEWTVERDEDLTAPYAFKDKMWIAFEDRISLSIKGKYVLLRDLPGLAVHNVENDFKTNCGMPLTHEVHRSFSNFKRKSRAAVLNALEDDLHQKELEYSTKVKSSDFRVVRVVDTEGHIRVVRENTQTEFTCSRQGYFVHPKSCNRFYRCVKFNQEVEDYSVFEFDCPAGLSFDERTEVCVWPGSMPEGSPCPGSSEIAPVTRIRFECPSKSGYYADPQNPRWFFACIDLGGPEIMAYEFRCPFGLIFDEQKLICEWPWLVAGYSGTGYTRSEYDGGYYGTGTTAGTGGYYTGALPHGYTGTSGGGGYTVSTGSGFSGAAGVGHGSSFGQGTKYTGSGKEKGYSGSGQGAGYTGSGVAGHGTSYDGQGADGYSGTTGSGYSGAAGAGHGTTYSGQGSGGYSGTTGSGYSGAAGAGHGTTYSGQGSGGYSGTTGSGYSGAAGAGHGTTYSGQGSGGYSGTTGSEYSGAAGIGHGTTYSGQGSGGYSGTGVAGHGTTYIGQGSGGYSGTTGSGYSGAAGAGHGTTYSGQGSGGYSGTTGSGYSGAAGAGHGTTYSGQGSGGYSGTTGSGYSTGGAGYGTKYTGQGFGGHYGTTVSGYSGTAGVGHGSTYNGQGSGRHSGTTGGEHAGAAEADHGTPYTGQGFTGTTGSGYSSAGATITSGHGYSGTGTSYTGSTGKAGYGGSTGTGYSRGTGTGQVSTGTGFTGAGIIEQTEKSGTTGTGYTGSTYSAAGSTDGGYSGTKEGSISGGYPGTKSGSSGGGYSGATGGTTGGYAGPGGIHGGSTSGGFAGSTVGGYTGAGTTGAHAGSTGGYAGPGGIHSGSTGGGFTGSTAGEYTGAGATGAHAGSTGGYAGPGGIHGGSTGGGYAGSTAGGYTGAGTTGAHAGSTGGYTGPGGIHGGSTGGGFTGSTAGGYTGAGTSGAHAGSTGGYAGPGGIHGGSNGGGFAGSTAGGYTGAGTTGAHAGSTAGYAGPGGIHGGSTGGGFAGSTAGGYTGAGITGAHAGSTGGYTGTSGGYGGTSIPGQTITFGTGQSRTPIFVSSGTTGAGVDHGVTSIYSQTPGPIIVEKPEKPTCLTNLCYGSSQPSGGQTLVTDDYVSSHGAISGTNVYQGTTGFPGSLNVTFGSHVPSIGGVTYHGGVTPAGGYTVTTGTGAIVTGHGIQGSIITGDSTPGTLITHGATPGAIFTGSSDQGTIISGGSHPGYTKTGLSSPGYVISGGVKTVFPGSVSSGTTVYGTPSPGVIVTGTPSPGVVVTGTPSPGTIIKGQSSPGIILTGQTAPGVSIGGSIVPGTVIGSGFSTHPGAVTPGSPFGTKIGTTPSTYVTGYKTNEYHDNGGRGTIRFNNGDVTTKYTENDIPDYRPTGGNILPDTLIPGSKGIPGVSLSSGFTKTGPTKTGFTTATLGAGGSYVISTGKTNPPPNPDHIGAKAFEGNVAGYPKSSTESSAKTYSGTFSTYGPGFSQKPSKGTGYSYPTPSIPFDTGVTKNLPISSTESGIFSGTTPTPFLKVEVHNTPKFGEAGFTSSPVVVNTYQKPSGFTRAPSPTGTPVLYTTGPLENYKTTVFEAAKVPVTISTIHPVIDTGYQTVISSTPLPVTISQDKFSIQTKPQFGFGTKTSQPGIFGDRGYVSSTTPTTVFKISSKYPSGEPQYDYGLTTPSSGSGYFTTSKNVFEHVTPSGISESPKPQTQYIPGESISPAIGVTYRKPFPLPGVTYQQEFTPASVKSYTTAPSGIGSGPGYKGSPTNIAIPRDEVGKLVTNYNRGTTKYVPNQYDVYTTGSAAGVDYYQSQTKFKQGYDSSTPSSVPRTQSPLTVTTYTGGYSKPSSGITYQTTAKSTAVGKPKVIVKWSDLHPLLLGKLGAECTCRGDPFANLRGPGSKLINSSKGKVDLSNYDESEIYVDLEKEGSYEDQDYQVTNYESSSKQPVKIYNELSKALGATSIQVQEKPSSTYLPSVTPSVGVGGRTSGLSSHGLTANFRSGKSLSNVGSPINSIGGGKGLASTVDHSVIGPIDGSVNSPTDDSIDGPIDRSGEYEDSVSEEIIDGATNCARPGLFRHPNFCNKFYACHWDEWKKKFTLHTFNCPVHLTFDNGAGACNWPSMGPACQDNNLLV